MILNLIRGKNVLLAFSDPAGAKQVLSFATKYRNFFKLAVAVSDRVHDFYLDFGIEVEEFKLATPREWLVRNQIDLLITGTSLPLNLEIDLIEEASKSDVVSLSLIDHWINMKARFGKANSLVLPDWIGVVDERAREIAVEDGLPTTKLLITGNPYYDFIASWRPVLSREDFLNSIDLPADAVYYLYAPEPLTNFKLQKKYGFTEIDGIRMIYEAIKPVKDNSLFILIKGHPNQRHELFVDYVSSMLDANLIYLPKSDINLCMYYSECVFGFFSNSMIEAALMGKLVIRPLMMMNIAAFDPLQKMESHHFITFYEQEKFEKAIQMIVRMPSLTNTILPLIKSQC